MRHSGIALMASSPQIAPVERFARRDGSKTTELAGRTSRGLPLTLAEASQTADRVRSVGSGRVEKGRFRGPERSVHWYVSTGSAGDGASQAAITQLPAHEKPDSALPSSTPNTTAPA